MTQGRPDKETRGPSDSPHKKDRSPKKRDTQPGREARGRGGLPHERPARQKQKGPWREPGPFEHPMAGYAGLEPATSDVTGRRSNQLS